MLAGSTPARAPRPVADAPLEALADSDGLAKGWLLTLIADAPLQQAAAVPAAELARDAPPLCAAMTASLASNDALDRLRPAGDLAPLAARAGRVAGAVDPAGTAGALAALRGVLWNAIADGLRAPDPELVSALAARLGHVCDVVAASALASAPAAAPVAPAVDDSPRLAAVPDDAPGQTAPAAAPVAPAPAPSVPADVFPTVSASPPMDDRHEPWATAVVRRVERLLVSGSPVAVLAVDIDGAELLLASDLHGEARSVLDRVERALRDELRPGDAAVRERDGRLWIVGGGTTLEGARALGRRLANAASNAGTVSGTPLQASIGIAISPDDGTDAASLVAHADEGVFAARAAGVDLA
jgi:GGDEF domain-containing protein